MLITMSGDLFASEHLCYMGHGCNALGSMGAGIAVAFKKHWPKMYEEYRSMCKAGQLRVGDCYVYQDQHGNVIYNLISQHDYKGPVRATPEGVRDSMDKALAHAATNSVPYIAVPAIGAGLGGMNMVDVLKIMSQLADKYPMVDIVFVNHYVPGKPVSYHHTGN